MHWGLQTIVKPELDCYGEVIGEIEQVPYT
jgi:hypothetical protein